MTEETLRVARVNRMEAASDEGGSGSDREPRELSRREKTIGGRRGGPLDNARFFSRDGELKNGGGDDAVDSREDFACALAETLGFVTLDDIVLRDARSDARRTFDAQSAPPTPRYGALRVASDGWEMHVLEGAREWLATTPPAFVLVEVTFAKLFFFARDDDAGAAERAAAETFAWLASLGYAEGAHAGQACDARRKRKEKAVSEDDAGERAETLPRAFSFFETDAEGESSEASSSSYRSGDWCAFEPADVPFVARAACPERPESVLLRWTRSAFDVRDARDGHGGA